MFVRQLWSTCWLCGIPIYLHVSSGCSSSTSFYYYYLLPKNCNNWWGTLCGCLHAILQQMACRGQQTHFFVIKKHTRYRCYSEAKTTYALVALWPSLRENLRRGRGTGRPEPSHCVTLINSPVTIYTQSVTGYLIAFAEQNRNHINCINVILITHNYNNACRPRQWSRYSDSPWAGWSGDWILVGVRFSAPIQTGPEGHPTICTTGTGSLYLGVRVAGAWQYRPLPSSAKVKVRVQLYLYSPSGPSWLEWPLPL